MSTSVTRSQGLAKVVCWLSVGLGQILSQQCILLLLQGHNKESYQLILLVSLEIDRSNWQSTYTHWELTEVGKGIKVICAYTSSVSKSACRKTTETHLRQPLKSSVVDKVAELRQVSFWHTPRGLIFRVERPYKAAENRKWALIDSYMLDFAGRCALQKEEMPQNYKTNQLTRKGVCPSVHEG
jgi:hypothetical protein